MVPGLLRLHTARFRVVPCIPHSSWLEEAGRLLINGGLCPMSIEVVPPGLTAAYAACRKPPAASWLS
jgi:hypothetical protein